MVAAWGSSAYTFVPVVGAGRAVVACGAEGVVMLELALGAGAFAFGLAASMGALSATGVVGLGVAPGVVAGVCFGAAFVWWRAARSALRRALRDVGTPDCAFRDEVTTCASWLTDGPGRWPNERDERALAGAASAIGDAVGAAVGTEDAEVDEDIGDDEGRRFGATLEPAAAPA